MSTPTEDTDSFVARLECALFSHNQKYGTNVYYDPHQVHAISSNGGRILARVNGLSIQPSYINFINHLKKELGLTHVDLSSQIFGDETEPSLAIVANISQWNSDATNNNNTQPSQALFPREGRKSTGWLRNLGCCRLTILAILVTMLLPVFYALIVQIVSGQERHRTYK